LLVKENIMVDKALLESVTARISEVCRRGPLIHVAGNIPSYTIHAYNRIIEDTGFVIGWADKESHLINFENLSGSLEQALSLYLKAKDGMAKFGIDDYVARQMSPVLIINSLLNGKIEESLIPSLANSHIYSALALLELADFHEHCRPFLYDDLFPETIDNLTALVLAQSYLLVAQDATNKAYDIMYQANDFVREKISTTDEVSLQLKIEKDRLGKSNGGKHSQYKPYEKIIAQELELYLNNWAVKQKHAIKKIEDNISAFHNVNLEVGSSTFNSWLSKYKANNQKYIFK
jgi:hypothetical protein